MALCAAAVAVCLFVMPLLNSSRLLVRRRLLVLRQ
jgi:hypothetical protein